MATPTTEELTEKLGIAFDRIITDKFGDKRAPEAFITPFGIKHLDALLGGGIISSGPVMFCSTPETGKSTIAFQFSSIFQQLYKNSIIVYLDIEGSGNIGKSTQFRVSRIDTFGLNEDRFKYEPILLNVIEVFDLVDHLIKIKRQFEEKLKKEFHVLFIWDSIPATPSSKTDAVDDPNRIIGLKARQLSFCLDKYSPLLKFNRITFIGIDQVRANMQIDGSNYIPKEKSIGVFKDMKGASNIFALQHNLQQYLFISKKKAITAKDGMGIDGWVIDIFTEKNKVAPSQHWISCVFDKASGIHKFWSEYLFLEDFTPSEAKIYKGSQPKKPPFKFMIKKKGAWVYLHVKHPSDSSIEYKSDSFYKKDALTKYNTDDIFRKWFDYAVDLSVKQRILEGLFILAPHGVHSIECQQTEDQIEELAGIDVESDNIQFDESVISNNDDIQPTPIIEENNIIETIGNPVSDGNNDDSDDGYDPTDIPDQLISSDIDENPLINPNPNI